MVRKHPHMFLGAQLVVINKIELAETMGVSIEALTEDVHKLKPDIQVIATSCKTGAGIDDVAAAICSPSEKEHGDARTFHRLDPG